jgi:hypothetical protein
MQDIGQLVSRTRLTGLLLIALILSACSGGSAGSSTATTSPSSGTGSTASGTTVGTTGTAILTWVAPTENISGTQVTDLAGYRVYYGTDPSNLTESVEVSGPASTTYEVENLAPGTYYFAVAAYNSLGAESEQSNVASITT